MSKTKDNVIKEFIIGFGFLSGLWFTVGISPSQVAQDALKPYLVNIHPLVQWAFIVVPTMIMAFNIIKIYARGGLVGIIAVAFAFASGALVFKVPQISVALLLVAIIVGWLSLRK